MSDITRQARAGIDAVGALERMGLTRPQRHPPVVAVMRAYLAGLAVALAVAVSAGYAVGGPVWALTMVAPVGAVFSVYSAVRTWLDTR